MTLEDFAKQAGVTLGECGPEWGGRVSYAVADHPNCRYCGFRTPKAAYKHWLDNSFGETTSKAILTLLKRAK